MKNIFFSTNKESDSIFSQARTSVVESPYRRQSQNVIINGQVPRFELVPRSGQRVMVRTFSRPMPSRRW